MYCATGRLLWIKAFLIPSVTFINKLVDLQRYTRDLLFLATRVATRLQMGSA